jgi:hypothetical protein
MPRSNRSGADLSRSSKMNERTYDLTRNSKKNKITYSTRSLETEKIICNGGEQIELLISGLLVLPLLCTCFLSICALTVTLYHVF